MREERQKAIEDQDAREQQRTLDLETAIAVSISAC